jgi:hypothetical protein
MSNFVPSLQIVVTLMMEAPSYSETSLLTSATQCNIPEGVIILSHRREYLKYDFLYGVRYVFSMGYNGRNS